MRRLLAGLVAVLAIPILGIPMSPSTSTVSPLPTISVSPLPTPTATQTGEPTAVQLITFKATRHDH